MQSDRILTDKGQKTLANMKHASTLRPDLTLNQSVQIVNASTLSADYSKYKNQIATYITEIYQTLTLKERPSFQYLVESARHPCSQEFTNSNTGIEDKIIEMKSQNQSQELIDSLIMGRIYGISIMLANGYQEQFHEHWQLDSNGNIIGLKPPHNVRQPICYSYIKKNKEKWRPGFSDLEYGGKKKRKTKKHSTKFKKTLRRK